MGLGANGAGQVTSAQVFGRVVGTGVVVAGRVVVGHGVDVGQGVEVGTGVVVEIKQHWEMEQPLAFAQTTVFGLVFKT